MRDSDRWDAWDEWQLQHVGQPLYCAYRVMGDMLARPWQALTQAIRPVLPFVLLAEVVALVGLVMWLMK
jgi:hypothetical protein